MTINATDDQWCGKETLMMTAPDRRLSFGIKTSQMGLGYEEILRIWREADQIPVFGHAWLWDHMVPLRGDITGAALEAWTLLAALAAQTTRLRLGVIVTSNRLRSPAAGSISGSAPGAAGSPARTPRCASSRPTACPWSLPVRRSATSRSRAPSSA